MKRVITYGTFDLLHYGHINLLKRAKALGDYLIVALSTDEFNWNEKQKKCYFSYEKRKQLLEAIRYVDLVIPEENWDQKMTDVDLYKVDIFVIGNIDNDEIIKLIDETFKINTFKNYKVDYFALEKKPRMRRRFVREDLPTFALPVIAINAFFVIIIPFSA